jgi:hypothetical protein
LLIAIEPFGRVEPAGKKNFIDELVEFGNIFLQLQFAFGSRVNELEAEPDAG